MSLPTYDQFVALHPEPITELYNATMVNCNVIERIDQIFRYGRHVAPYRWDFWPSATLFVDPDASVLVRSMPNRRIWIAPTLDTYGINTRNVGTNLIAVFEPARNGGSIVVAEFGCEHSHMTITAPYYMVRRYTCPTCGLSYDIDRGD